MIERAFIDLDGVIADWYKGFFTLMNIPADKEHRDFVKENPHMLNDHAWWSEQKSDPKLLEAGYDWWYNLEKLPWADDLCKTVQDTGAEIYFLTAVGKYHNGAGAKMDWLHKHFGTKNHIITKFKYLLATPNSILIDDLTKNTDKFKQHGGNIWLWPNQYCFMDGDIDIDKHLKDLHIYITGLNKGEI